jgi:hypothetical protein
MGAAKDWVLLCDKALIHWLLLMVLLHKVVNDGFQKCSEVSYKCSQQCELLKDSILKAAVTRGFLVLPDLRIGFCPRILGTTMYINLSV